MSISNNLKKILASGAALLMFASVGASGNLANAKRVHYHYCTHRVYRRHAKRCYRRNRKARVNKRRSRRHAYRAVRKPARRIRRRKARKPKLSGKLAYERKMFLTAFHEEHQPLKSEPKWMRKAGFIKMNTKSQISHQLKAARQQTLTDINADRAKSGQAPIIEDPALDKIASKRAWQVTYVHDGHFDPKTGRAYAVEDGINNDADGNWSENIGGMITARDRGYDNNGRTAADSANDTLYTNERPTASNPQGGGHYRNIVNPSDSSVGIGANYNQNSGYNIVEDFSNNA